MMLIASIVAAPLVTGGCAMWPPHGTGGLAELYATESEAILKLESRYRRLRRSVAATRMPAAMFEARRLLVRARREHAGGLHMDADHTIAMADDMIREMEVLTPGISVPGLTDRWSQGHGLLAKPARQPG